VLDAWLRRSGRPASPAAVDRERQEVEKENRASNSDGREHNRRLQADGSKRAASEKGKKKDSYCLIGGHGLLGWGSAIGAI
jgi:hypothetical protein